MKLHDNTIHISKLFPKNMLANIFGFDVKPYFEAQQGAETAPKVEF